MLPSNYFLGNNYFPSTYFLVSKYSLHEISNPLEIVWRVVFSLLNTSGSSIILGNIYSLVKPLYWNKRKQPLKSIPLHRCSKKVSKIFQKYQWKISCLWLFLNHFTKIESFFLFWKSGTTIFKEQLFFLNKTRIFSK